MNGIGVSQGIGIGRVFKVENNEVKVEKINITNTDISKKVKKCIGCLQKTAR